MSITLALSARLYVYSVGTSVQSQRRYLLSCLASYLPNIYLLEARLFGMGK